MAATRRHLIALLALASSILVLPAVPSSAESMCTATLVVTSGEFTDPTAWSSGSVPGPGDYACVPRTTTTKCSNEMRFRTAALACSSVTAWMRSTKASW